MALPCRSYVGTGTVDEICGKLLLVSLTAFVLEAIVSGMIGMKDGEVKVEERGLS